MPGFKTFRGFGDPGNHLKSFDSQLSFWASDDEGTGGENICSIGRQKDTPKPLKLKVPPNPRDEKKLCEYHKYHGHDTDECRLLNAEIENLIRQGQLKEFVRKDQGSPSRLRGRTPPRRNTDSDKDHDAAPQITRRVNTISGGIAGGGDTSNARRRYARIFVYSLAPMMTID
ncbi:hypothetical protein LIER_15123 [Lithospermum erythrorhizon]|uniref:Reverse transcriptase domain-containing protein n=1 Tax=Lithospermum erythrorhizon TaxID=34254 RepID=A0AAV3Q387_LITER